MTVIGPPPRFAVVERIARSRRSSQLWAGQLRAKLPGPRAFPPQPRHSLSPASTSETRFNSGTSAKGIHAACVVAPSGSLVNSPPVMVEA